MGPRPGRSLIGGHGQRQCYARWCIVDRSGRLSVDTIQTGLSCPMPLTIRATNQILAPEHLWTAPGGNDARLILSWMLLVAHGASIRGRLDEPALDRRPRILGFDREATSSRGSRKPTNWYRTHSLGRSCLIAVDSRTFSGGKRFAPTPGLRCFRTIDAVLLRTYLVENPKVLNCATELGPRLSRCGARLQISDAKGYPATGRRS